MTECFHFPLFDYKNTVYNVANRSGNVIKYKITIPGESRGQDDKDAKKTGQDAKEIATLCHLP